MSAAQLQQQVTAAGGGRRPAVGRCTEGRRRTSPRPTPATAARYSGTSWTSAGRSRAGRLSRVYTLVVQTVTHTHTHILTDLTYVLLLCGTVYRF